MFRWAVPSKLVPEVVAHAMCMLAPLKYMRCEAREVKPVKPVCDEHIAAVLPHLLPQTRAMVEVQLLTGMRPQDVRNLRTGDIDMTGPVWVYEPWTHKCEHHGLERRIAIGPRAQDILRAFLKPEQPEVFVFSPREAVAAWHRKRRQECQHARRSRAPAKGSAVPKRCPGSQYTKSSYEAAIWRACRKANIPRWGPNRLRHACGTKVRRKYGIEGAAATLGNGLGTVTEVYAEKVFELAIKIASEIG
jgi:integrase